MRLMPRTRWGRDGLLVVLALVGLGLLAHDHAEWFPQRWAHEFYVVKAVAGLVAVVTTVTHMARTWPRVGTTAQRLRYLLLLGFVMVVATGSTAQYEMDVPVTGRSIAGLALAVMATPVALLSIRQDDRR